MSVAEFFQRFLHLPVSAPPPPPPDMPSDEEIRRAKQQVVQLVRRAEALGIEVEMEELTR